MANVVKFGIQACLKRVNDFLSATFAKKTTKEGKNAKHEQFFRRVISETKHSYS